MLRENLTTENSDLNSYKDHTGLIPECTEKFYIIISVNI